jgi:hypothetical protein
MKQAGASLAFLSISSCKLASASLPASPFYSVHSNLALPVIARDAAFFAASCLAQPAR